MSDDETHIAEPGGLVREVAGSRVEDLALMGEGGGTKQVAESIM